MLTSKNALSRSVLDAKRQHMRKDQRSCGGKKKPYRGLGRRSEREKEHGSNTRQESSYRKVSRGFLDAGLLDSQLLSVTLILKSWPLH